MIISKEKVNKEVYPLRASFFFISLPSVEVPESRRKAMAGWVLAFWKVYKELHFAYLEINPVVMLSDTKVSTYHLPTAKYQSRFLGRGCDEALFSEKKGFSVKRGEAIQ